MKLDVPIYPLLILKKHTYHPIFPSILPLYKTFLVKRLYVKATRGLRMVHSVQQQKREIFSRRKRLLHIRTTILGLHFHRNVIIDRAKSGCHCNNSKVMRTHVINPTCNTPSTRNPHYKKRQYPRRCISDMLYLRSRPLPSSALGPFRHKTL